MGWSSWVFPMPLRWRFRHWGSWSSTPRCCGARRGRARLGLAAGSLLLATPYLAPWYLVWAAPLAAAEDDGRAQLLVLALSAYLLPQTIPT